MKNNSFKNNIFLLKLIWKYSPVYVVLEFLNGIIMGIWSSVDIIFIKEFYELLSMENTKFISLLNLIFAMIIFGLINQIWFQFYRNVIKPIMQQKLEYGMHKDFFYHAKRIELKFYYNSDFYNDYIWSMRQSDAQTKAMLQTFSSIATMIVSLVTTTIVLSVISPILCIISIVSSVITVVLKHFVIKVKYNQNVAQNFNQRRKSNYEDAFYNRNSAKELRISKVSNVLLENRHECLKEIEKTDLYFNNKKIRFELPLNILGKILQPIVYMILLYQILVLKSADISTLAVAFSAFWSLRGRIQAIIDLISRIPEQSLYIEKIKKFLNNNMLEKVGSLKPEVFQLLEIDNVTFKYDNTIEVLKKVNINIKKGEKIAIVGNNGSGKTTLINLILGLFTPSSGEIRYNGKKISEYDIDHYRDNMSVIFQDFQIYALSISENVLCNEWNENSDATVEHSIEKVGLKEKINNLYDGKNTILTNEFSVDGTMFSGGEMQKIAIARIFAKDRDIIIMDEPSASLDPISEAKLNGYIATCFKDKTIIFISHRLTTTKYADKIFVLENGVVIEEGSHQELMKINGKYTKMYNAQCEKYLSMINKKVE